MSVERKAAKMNVRMFNFSKMVQNPRALRYQDHKQYVREKEKIPKHGPVLGMPLPESKSQINKYEALYSSIGTANKRPYLQLENTIEEETITHHLTHSKHEEKKSLSEEMKAAKVRQGFPSSFYRIKYHNNQRRKLESRKNNPIEEKEEYKQIQHLARYNLQNLTSSQRDYLESQPSKRKEDGMFIKIRRCPQ